MKPKFGVGDLVNMRYAPPGAIPYPVKLDGVRVLEVCPYKLGEPAYMIEGAPQPQKGRRMWVNEKYLFPYDRPADKSFGELMTATKGSTIKSAEIA